jgi:hypothetical protein
MTFVANELLFTPGGPGELADLLNRYGGIVVNDGSLLAPPSELRDAAAGRAYIASEPRTYTIRLDPSHYNTQNTLDYAHKQGLALETVRFSSENAARLLAIVLQERANGSKVSLNLVSQAHGVPEQVPKTVSYDGGRTWIPEDAMQWQTFHDDNIGVGNPFSLCADSNFTWYCNYSSSGSNVYMAWRFVADYAPSYRPKLAIIDGGFWLDQNGDSKLDPKGGSPLPHHPSQGNLANGSYNASGTNKQLCSGGSPCPYHGTGTSNVAMASLSYGYDGAGTGGQVADPILLYTDGSSDQMAKAVLTAVYWGADIISISSAIDCGQYGSFWCRNYDAFGGYHAYAKAIDDAQKFGVLVVASAGNEGKDASSQFPCYYGPVLCVGALGDGQSRPISYSNFAGPVRIWAPTNIPAIYPNADGTFYFPKNGFPGTSASAPFVAGIAAMLKAVNPKLTGDQFTALLLENADGSNTWDEVYDMRPDDNGSNGRLVRRVNAYKAVLAAAGGYYLKPDIKITSPSDGATVLSTVTAIPRFTATAADVQDGQWPLQSYGPKTTPIRWTSDVDGFLGDDTGIIGLDAPEGLRHVTATVTNSHGASNSATIAVTIKYNHVTPSPVIVWPPANTSVPAGTYVLTGYAKSTDPGVLGNLDCNRLVWTDSALGVSVPAVPVPNSNGLCQAQLNFPNGWPSDVVTLSATDKFGDKGSTFVIVNISAPAAQGQLAVQIVNPGSGTYNKIVFNSGATIGLEGSATPLSPKSAPSYTWYWYYTSKGAGTRQKIATGTTATWNAQTSGLCQVSGPQDVSIELDVVDFVLSNPTQTATGSAIANIKVDCQHIN